MWRMTGQRHQPFTGVKSEERWGCADRPDPAALVASYAKWATRRQRATRAANASSRGRGHGGATQRGKKAGSGRPAASCLWCKISKVIGKVRKALGLNHVR